jgi:hypothetical protein
MLPFITYTETEQNEDGRTISPFIVKDMNHNVINEQKVMNLIHTMLGNPYYSNSDNRDPPLQDMGSDMIAFIGVTDNTDPNGECTGNDTNTMIMTRLNPCASYNDEKEKITSLTSFDETYIKFIKSDEFRDLLLIDGTTKEGQKAIAEHYGVSDEWKDLINVNVNNDDLTQYYNLLYLVKTESKNDHVWISFVEGLHRHAAIVLSLLCSKFDYQNNTLVSKSLHITNFEKADIPGFARPTDSTLTPERLLNDIYLLDDIDNKDSDYSTMLKKPFTVKAYFPSNNNCDTNTLISTLRSISSLHSKNKLNSAQKSISRVTADVLIELTKNSTAAQRNNTIDQPTFNEFSVKYIEKTNKQYESQLINDDDTFLNYASLLVSEPWLKYINNPNNSVLRNSLINTVCPVSTKYNKPHQPPFGLHFENLTNDSIYVKSNKKFSAINSSHVNAFFIIPPIVNSLLDKLNSNKLGGSDVDTKVKIIHYLTRIECGTKAPNLHTHQQAINHYCSQANHAEYIQDLSGIYKAIPVTVFLVALYNASYMFNDDKSGNFLISALDRFDLGTTVTDDTFMDIMSKFLKYMKYASFSKL